MRSFFEESLMEITESLWDILKDITKIKFILLVGSYALSQVLRKHIEKESGSKYKVLCPDLPQEAVLRGAVMFGRDKGVIESRKSRFTYGFDAAERFDSSKHNEQRKFTNSKGESVDGVFYKMVEIHEDVGWNKKKILHASSSKKQTDNNDIQILPRRAEKPSIH